MVTVTAMGIPSSVIAKTTTTSTVADTVDIETNEEKPQEEEDKVGVIVKEVEEKREAAVKHFLKDDYTYEAVVYSENVHYYENGQWKEIDNTLEETENSDFTTEESNGKASKEKNALKNKKNNYEISFAKNAKSNKLVSIKQKNYKLSWNVQGAQKTKYSIVETDTEALEEIIEKETEEKVNASKKYGKLNGKEKEKVKKNLVENEKKKIAEKAVSAIEYKEILPNVDLKYTLAGEKVKEDVVINKYIKNFEITFNLDMNNLEARLEANNTISFYDPKEPSKVIFTTDAPFIYDQDGAFTTNVEVKLSKDKNKKGYKLTLIPDNQWMSSKERAYPLVLDPVVQSSTDVNSIQDAFVAQSLPTTNYQTAHILGVGKGSDSGVTRSYIKFTLPTLSSADMVTYSELALWLYNSNSTVRQINAHKVLANWDSATITWNNKPNFDSTVEDYAQVSGNSGNYFIWDVTSIAKEWYTSGNNYGLMLKNKDESVGYNTFFSSDVSATYANARPRVIIQYVNTSGLEPYWTYHSQDVGRAGTGYVNDYTGNLVFVHNDLSMTGNRMPVSINHVYNNNSNNSDTNKNYGIGWRLNVSQRIAEKTINGVLYYVYTDEDGTIHYFKKDSSGVFKDESGLDLTAVKNSDGTYVITDKKHNKLKFTKSGYLWTITDSNNNTMTLTYDGTFLKTITDGAGRKTTFDVLSNGYLVGITDSAGRKTSFAYNGTQLSKITYPDGKATTFTYDSNNKLTSATNYDGYKMTYSYSAGSAKRVTKILESNTNGTLGNELNLFYGFNSTTFTDVKGRKNIYQFNNAGNTLSIQDSDGNAQYYKYGTGSNVNKLTLESKVQKTTVNYLLNHNAEKDGYWSLTSWVNDNDSTGQLTTEAAYLGQRSFKVTKTSNQSRDFYQQYVNLTKGKTYTLSGYVKTKGVDATRSTGAAIFAYYTDTNGKEYKPSTTYIKGTNEWQRVEVTFTLPSNMKDGSFRVGCGLIETTGTAYFDCIQLEDGPIANRYNLVENADFRGGSLEFWGKSNCTTSDVIANGGAPSTIDTNSFKIVGDAKVNKNIYQTINISGKKGDIFVVSGWAKASSVPTGKNGKYFALDIGILKTDGTYQWEVIPFNQDIADWQYVSDKVVANSDYKSINIYGLYYMNENTAYFDGFRLYKEEFGTSYQYDSKGNLVSTVDLAKQNSTFDYSSNNDLTKSVSPKGSKFNYDYDSKHNLIKASSGENVVYSFSYDSYGNPLTAKVGEGTLFIQSTATYTSSGNYVSKTTDASGNTITNN